MIILTYIQIYIFNLNKSKGKEGILNMDNMKISGGLGIFKRNKTSENEQKEKIESNRFSSNPFGMTFKGVQLHGDVFQASSPSQGLQSRILKQGKMAVSAAMATLVEIKNIWARKLEPVISALKSINERTAHLTERLSKLTPQIIVESLRQPAKVRNRGISRAAHRVLSKYGSVDNLAIAWQTHPAAALA